MTYRHTDRQTDRRTDDPGKSNMSPNPKCVCGGEGWGGGHNFITVEAYLTEV